MKLLNDYEIHQRRQIMHYARKSKSMEELKSNLKKRGITMQYKNSIRKETLFTAKNFKIDSVKGKDRVFTELARKTVEKNNPKISSIKEAQKTNNYAKFDRIRAERDQKTPQHNRQKTI